MTASGDPEPALGAADERPSAGRRGYRPALDGLRAAAVTGVIAYHLGWLHGGFLGVDAFFVLSGYLITSLLLREFSDRHTIGVTGFWARRARRLLPAVLLLIAVCLLELATIKSEAAVFAARRDDLISTLFYYANWHFIAADQSYFATFFSASPLRHMWSLAIEEQFYLVWPLLLLLALRVMRRRILVVVIAAAAVLSSLDLAYQYEAHDPSRAYFGTDSRAHVLLVGALLAMAAQARPAILRHPHAQRAASRAALPIAALVLAAYIWIADQAPIYYYGGSLAFAALVALLIWSLEASSVSWVTRFMSLRPISWVGRISYSLYLWHWPIIIWVSSFIAVSSIAQKGLALGATVAMASISYYVVESPIRYGRVRWLRKSNAKLVVAVPIALLTFAALSIYVTRSRTSELSERPCPPGSPTVNDLRYCVEVEPTRAHAPVLVTAGDSTSRALTPGLTDWATKQAWRFVQAGQNGCSLLPLDLVREPQFQHEQDVCRRDVPPLLNTIGHRYQPRVWVVADEFALAPLHSSNGSTIASEDPRRGPMIAAALRKTLRAMTRHGSRVVLIADPPRGAPPQCGTRTTGPTCGSNDYSTDDPATSSLRTIYRRVASEFPRRVVVISVTDLLCTKAGHCPAVIDGVLARYDGVHYTARFSRLIVPHIIARAERAGVQF